MIGLEPSCILSFRDEIPAMVKDRSAQQLATQSFTFEEFLAREAKDGRLNLPLKRIADRALVHGHCHQKAFDVFSPVEAVLKLIPDLKVEQIESSCCGMAGSFGYAAETIDVSLAMGRSYLCYRRSGRRMQVRSSSPMARPAAIRSTMAPAARRFMLRACWLQSQ